MPTHAEVSLALRQYCFHHITARTQDLAPIAKSMLVQGLSNCPFRPLMQAWAVFDLYQFKCLHEEGLELLLGWPDRSARPADLMALVHPDDLAEVGELYQKALAKFMSVPGPTAMRGRFCVCYRMQHHDGQFRKVMETITTLEYDPASSAPLACLRQFSGVEAIWSGSPVRHEFQLMRYDSPDGTCACQSLHFHPARQEQFLPQELRIAELVRAGLPSKVIADQICLSKHSVDRYRKLILQKTASRNITAAIRKLEQLGLI